MRASKSDAGLIGCELMSCYLLIRRQLGVSELQVHPIQVDALVSEDGVNGRPHCSHSDAQVPQRTDAVSDAHESFSLYNKTMIDTYGQNALTNHRVGK